MFVIIITLPFRYSKGYHLFFPTNVTINTKAFYIGVLRKEDESCKTFVLLEVSCHMTYIKLSTRFSNLMLHIFKMCDVANRLTFLSINERGPRSTIKTTHRRNEANHCSLTDFISLMKVVVNINWNIYNAVQTTSDGMGCDSKHIQSHTKCDSSTKCSMYVSWVKTLKCFYSVFMTRKQKWLKDPHTAVDKKMWQNELFSTDNT